MKLNIVAHLVVLFFLFKTILTQDAFQEFKVKRKNVFEFSKKPSLTQEKNQAVISFTTKDMCDVTIAIENSDGKIVRHLASGVLGSNAPEPFQKDSLEQNIIWDYKDDSGRYIDVLDTLKIRVSLGLQAEYEKDLYYSPYKRISSLPLMCAAPEGIYVYEGRGRDHLRLFGHDGKYIKAIYPFPASQIKNVIGLKWWKAPNGTDVLYKESRYHQTLLTSGENDDKSSQFGRSNGVAVLGLAVNGKRIALAYEHLNRVATDGSSGGFPLKGEKTCIHVDKNGYDLNGLAEQIVGPSSVAFSPDGKTIYMTGYMWSLRDSHNPNSLMGVLKMNYEANEGRRQQVRRVHVVGDVLGVDDDAVGEFAELRHVRPRTRHRAGPPERRREVRFERRTDHGRDAVQLAAARVEHDDLARDVRPRRVARSGRAPRRGDERPRGAVARLVGTRTDQDDARREPLRERRREEPGHDLRRPVARVDEHVEETRAVHRDPRPLRDPAPDRVELGVDPVGRHLDLAPAREALQVERVVAHGRLQR